MDDPAVLRLLLAELRRLDVRAGHVYREEQLHWWHTLVRQTLPDFAAVDRDRAIQLALTAGLLEPVSDPASVGPGWRLTASGAASLRATDPSSN